MGVSDTVEGMTRAYSLPSGTFASNIGTGSSGRGGGVGGDSGDGDDGAANAAEAYSMRSASTPSIPSFHIPRSLGRRFWRAVGGDAKEKYARGDWTAQLSSPHVLPLMAQLPALYHGDMVHTYTSANALTSTLATFLSSTDKQLHTRACTRARTRTHTHKSAFARAPIHHCAHRRCKRGPRERKPYR